jgi:hypothetical protein
MYQKKTIRRNQVCIVFSAATASLKKLSSVQNVATLHAHLIETRWTLSTGQWTSWTALTYPPSNAGVTGLSADTQQSITYLTVQLDDGSCWQRHKVSPSPDSTWTSFYSC